MGVTGHEILDQQRIAITSAGLFFVLSLLAFRPLGLAPWGILFLPALLAPLVIAFAVQPAERTRHLRAVIIFGTGAFFLIFSLVVQMVSRQQTAPHRYIHDGAVQTEDAVHFLERGVNPYSADYRQGNFGAFVDMFSSGARPNPAWTHYVYLPFPVVASVPVDWVLRHWAGWYDQRIVYFLFELLAIILVMRLARDLEWRLFVGTLFLLNPFWTGYAVFGFNDIVTFALLAGALLALQRRQWTAAGIWYGLAAASKQHAWLFAPFLAAYLWYERRWQPIPWKRTAVATLVTAAIILAPFFLWDPGGFIEDIYRFPTGSATLSYPASGIGLSSHFVRWGLMRSMYDYYPFIIFQALVAGPLLFILLRLQGRSNTLARLVVGQIVFAAVFWYLSRYFNTNYLSYLSFLAIAALAMAGPPRRFLTAPVYG